MEKIKFKTKDNFLIKADLLDQNGDMITVKAGNSYYSLKKEEGYYRVIKTSKNLKYKILYALEVFKNRLSQLSHWELALLFFIFIGVITYILAITLGIGNFTYN